MTRPKIIDKCEGYPDTAKCRVRFRNRKDEPWRGGTGEPLLGNIRESIEGNRRWNSWKFRYYLIEPISPVTPETLARYAKKQKQQSARPIVDVKESRRQAALKAVATRRARQKEKQQ